MTDDTQWNLGRFIRVSTRSDGSHRVFMSVPAKCRSAGWPKTIQLPEMYDRRGHLSNPIFRERVAKDVARLNKSLDLERDREALLARHSDRTIVDLGEIIRQSARFKNVSAARRYRYGRSIDFLVKWSAARDHPEFASIFKPQIEAHLAAFDDRPSLRLEVRTMWNIMCTEAIDAGWRQDNPVKRVKWSRPRPEPINIWKQPDVERFARAACEMGQPGLAALMRVQFFIGQRLGDTRLCRHGVNYDGGGIGVRQSKSGEVVGVPLPQELRDLIEQVRVPGSDFLFNEARSGTAFGEHNIKHYFREARHRASDEGDPLLHLRALRHSAVCDMATLGLSTVLIASITGHKFKTIEEILERYAIDRHGFAREAAIRRHVATGGSESDFAPAPDAIGRDWQGRVLDRPTYVYPWTQHRRAA
jgi:integrase